MYTREQTFAEGVIIIIHGTLEPDWLRGWSLPEVRLASSDHAPLRARRSCGVPSFLSNWRQCEDDGDLWPTVLALRWWETELALDAWSASGVRFQENDHDFKAVQAENSLEALAETCCFLI